MNAWNTVEAKRYIAAHKAWRKAYDRAYKAIGSDGNETESIEAANAYQAMVDAREALMKVNN